MAKSRAKTSRRAAEQAVRTLLSWAGEDPNREGLRDTPHRVVDAYRDWFSGYQSDPAAYLRRTFEEVGGYDEMIVLRDISFESHCEHHMAPIIGRVHIGYLPADKVVIRSDRPFDAPPTRSSASASWCVWSRATRDASRCRRISPRRSPTASPRCSGRVVSAWWWMPYISA